MNLLDRITVHPDICHGKPTIRGSRYMVESILELLAAGSSYEELLEDYPSLEKEDIRASVFFGAQIVKNKGSFLFGQKYFSEQS